jgi:AraC-like DNA-binding protein
MGMRAGFGSIGLVGYAAVHSRSVGEALDVLVGHLHVHDRSAAPFLTVAGDMVSFGYVVLDPDIEGLDLVYDGAMAIACSLLRQVRGPDWHPAEVQLPRRAPRDIAPFREFFHARIRFNAESAALLLPKDQLDQPCVRADSYLASALRRMLADAGQPGDFADEVRRVLHSLARSGSTSIDDVAQFFRMHRRTVHRRLRDEGTDFRSLLDDVRFGISRQLLRATDTPVTEIAAVVGYSEPSAFTRAFRRWSGKSPREWREDPQGQSGD